MTENTRPNSRPQTHDPASAPPTPQDRQGRRQRLFDRAWTLVCALAAQGVRALLERAL